MSSVRVGDGRLAVATEVRHSEEREIPGSRVNSRVGVASSHMLGALRLYFGLC